MKINFMCGQCVMLALDPSNTYKMNDGIFIDMPISDSGIYEFECNTHFKHSNKILINNLKSDLLYDSAINAYNDGYLRESISSFYAALENFYIEIIKYFLSKSPNIDNSDTEKMFKSYIKLSERKLGAFYTLYLSHLNKVPPKFHDKYVNIRNNVIHGTYYPKNEDVLKFGKAVAKYIFDIYDSLKQVNPNFFSELELINMAKTPNNTGYSKSKQNSYISHYQNENNRPIIDFTEFKTNYSKNRAQK